ncbi:COX15/CtaA family protein [Aridibaculum aurantiacum]|uniref:COX15/CtaA family protein n=1 Tax=Aridibaculum aurantiacum TaxID=2810307 RepID=UPI001A972C73|nr:COX15/CtaA family protein [Aridibaculum aurantiacum]
MQNDRATKVIANWILLGIFMLVIQVLLGGITRLTGSGLSITEWKPIMGALPPMTEAQWQKAFEQYQQIAQYKYLNQHFSIGDFKFIFFWEWFHRLWARIIGIVFLIPFIYFIVKGYFKKWMIAPLVILFILGAAQGFVGWIMVQSGLNENDLFVSHIRLAAHFIAAMILIAYALIFWLRLVVPQQQFVAKPALRNAATAITVLIVIQLTFGAFMAGLKAATIASTWPDINGSYWPENMFANGFSKDAVYNRIAIHFIHRNLAYLLTIIIFIWWIAARKVKASTFFSRYRNASITLVILQVILGVMALLTADKIVPNGFGKFEWSALLHQLNGMLLFLNFIGIIYLAGKPKQVN